MHELIVAYFFQVAHLSIADLAEHLVVCVLAFRTLKAQELRIDSQKVLAVASVLQAHSMNNRLTGDASYVLSLLRIELEVDRTHHKAYAASLLRLQLRLAILELHELAQRYGLLFDFRQAFIRCCIQRLHHESLLKGNQRRLRLGAFLLFWDYVLVPVELQQGVHKVERWTLAVAGWPHIFI